ncbi:acr-7 [Pristionchus pacificus]|nr:acr-7 [Pristionchus pacificus]
MIYRLILVSILLALVDASKEEGELIETLIGNYSTLVRPVPDPALPLTVYIKVHLQQIITLDMKDQTMEMNAWIRYEWNDYQLRWNPEDFGNITSIRVNGGEESQIWMPDIILWNSCDDEHFDSRYTVNAVVYHDGMVNYIPPGVFKISCKVDITWFPFDEQLCYMHFSSWTYHRGAIDLQLGSSRDHKPAMDISTFVKNGQWHLVNAPSYREETVYTCCPEVYPFVRFYVHLRRRTLFYIFNVIIPSIIITLMTLITFILPPHDMSEKIGHQTTVVLSVSFFLTVISEMIPRTSESVPLLGIFFCTVTCIVSSSAAFTIMVLNMRYRQPGNHFFSASFRRVFCEFLPWLMMMKRPGHKFRKGKANKDKPSEVICVKCTDDYANIIDATGNGSGPEKAEKTKSLFHVLARVPAARLSLERKVGQGIFHRDGSVKSIKELQRDKFVSKTYNEIKNAKDEPTMVGFSILEAYMAISRKVEYLRSIHKKKKIRQHLQEEWKFAAMVFDRFLLFIFTVQITVSVMGLIYFAPYFDAV